MFVKHLGIMQNFYISAVYTSSRKHWLHAAIN